MRNFVKGSGIVILALGFSSAALVWASETIEIATYVPAPTASQGKLADHVYQENSSLLTISTLMPIDNGGNPPVASQIIFSQGTEILRATITPKASTNRLLVRASATFDTNIGGTTVMALFRDPTAPTDLAVTAATATNSSSAVHFHDQILITHEVDAGSTNPTTFVVRIGNNGSGHTLYLNGCSYGKLFRHKATITIDEFSQ